MDKPSPLPAHARFPRHPQRGVLCAKPFAPCSCPATLAAPSPSITPSPRSSVFPGSACSSVSHGDTGHHSPASPGPPTHLQPPAATSVPSVPSETILQIWRDVGATVPLSSPRDMVVLKQHSVAVITSLAQVWSGIPGV